MARRLVKVKQSIIATVENTRPSVGVGNLERPYFITAELVMHRSAYTVRGMRRCSHLGVDCCLDMKKTRHSRRSLVLSVQGFLWGLEKSKNDLAIWDIDLPCSFQTHRRFLSSTEDPPSSVESIQDDPNNLDKRCRRRFLRVRS